MIQWGKFFRCFLKKQIINQITAIHKAKIFLQWESILISDCTFLHFKTDEINLVFALAKGFRNSIILWLHFFLFSEQFPFWLGIIDKDHPGSFQWINGSFPDWTNFTHYSGDIQGGNRCSILTSDKDWQITPCDKEHYVLCEIPKGK